MIYCFILNWIYIVFLTVLRVHIDHNLTFLFVSLIYRIHFIEHDKRQKMCSSMWLHIMTHLVQHSNEVMKALQPVEGVVQQLPCFYHNSNFTS